MTRAPVLLLLLLAGVLPAHAQEAFLHGDESAAHADGPASLTFNPAIVGSRYHSEFAFTFRDLADGRSLYRSAIVTGPLTIAGSGAEHARVLFGLAIAGGDERTRWGLASNWIPRARGGRDLDHTLGMLTRPLPWFSLGAVADHLGRPRIDGVRVDREYTVGVGMRPLALSRPKAHTQGTRLTLTADARLAEDQRLDDARFRLGAEVEPVNGLQLRGSYETESKAFQLGVSLLGVRSGYHGQSAYDDDRHRLHTDHSVSFHREEDRTVFAGRGDRRVAWIRAGGDLGDDALSGVSINGSTRTVTVAGLHQQLERALEDPLTRGVFLDLRGVSNMAQIEELRPRIRRLREAGKPVVAWLESGGGRADFYMAAACDRVVSSPEAFYAGLGLRSERRYYRKLLDDWGVRIDRTSQGKYKSAYRNYSVDSTTAPDREVIDHSLDRLQDLFVNSITADRKISRERLMPVLDGRRWPPIDLQKAGLVDTVGYREDAVRILGRLTRLGDKPRVARLDRPEARREWTLPTRIAVIYATGSIESGRSGNDLLLGPFMGSETITRQIESAFKRRDVKAVVLRIESGGGSSLASDLMHHALVRMRGETKKPLIVSMGLAAASGGYHIALPARKIFADRFTRTGSIGVVFVKPSIEGWYSQHHVRQDFFERGRYMRGLSEAQDWDKEIQASADSAIQREYRDFVALVAGSRNLTWDQAHAVAQGRVWLGEDALDRKLVDAIGGLEEAVGEARREIGVPEGEKLRLVEYRRPRPGVVERLVGSYVTELWDRSAHVPDTNAALYWMEDPIDE
jgi:protease IV